MKSQSQGPVAGHAIKKLNFILTTHVTVKRMGQPDKHRSLYVLPVLIPVEIDSLTLKIRSAVEVQSAQLCCKVSEDRLMPVTGHHNRSFPLAFRKLPGPLVQGTMVPKDPVEPVIDGLLVTGLIGAQGI
jgi:hypothetical protein